MGPILGGELVSSPALESKALLLRGTLFVCETIKRKKDNNRSVMPLDALGCTRVTMRLSHSDDHIRDDSGNLRNSLVMGIVFCNYRT